MCQRCFRQQSSWVQVDSNPVGYKQIAIQLGTSRYIKIGTFKFLTVKLNNINLKLEVLLSSEMLFGVFLLEFLISISNVDTFKFGSRLLCKFAIASTLRTWSILKCHNAFDFTSPTNLKFCVSLNMHILEQYSTNFSCELASAWLGH